MSQVTSISLQLTLGHCWLAPSWLLRSMVVAVPTYSIPPALPRLVVEAGLGSLWLPLVLNFSCGVYCLYLWFGFFHAGLGSVGCRGSLQSVEFQGSVVRWAHWLPCSAGDLLVLIPLVKSTPVGCAGIDRAFGSFVAIAIFTLVLRSVAR
jgi:hypothetical protein